MRTSETTFRHVAGWMPGTVLVLALLLTACGAPGSPFGDDGSDANGSQTAGETNRTEDPDPDPDPDPGPGPGPDPEPDQPDPDSGPAEEYAWGLPPSDTSVGEQHQGVEGSAYIALQSSCAEGAAFLNLESAPEYGFESPRNVLLFAAGVRLCEGDAVGAAQFSGRAEAYGTAGLTPDDWAFCALYQVVRSVLEQRPPEDFRCAGGDPPPFSRTETDAGETFTDDPLTLDVDESVPPEPEPEPQPEPEPEPEPEPGPEPAPDVEVDETDEQA